MTYFLITVEVICSILLLGVILIQRTKSQGMGLAFGGAMGESIFGSQMGNVLTRTTVVLAIIFLVTTTLLAMLGARETAGDGSVMRGVAPTPPPITAPAPGTTPGGAAPVGPVAPDAGVAVPAPEMPATEVPAVPAPTE
ncbi:preprotein translocase subunit SecG [Verrucomicrobiota bacterium]